MNITLEEVLAFLTILGFISGIWWRIESMLRKNTDDLAAHKLHVAETYTTKQGLKDATDQIMVGISTLQEGVNKIATRVDHFMDTRPATRSRSKAT